MHGPYPSPRSETAKHLQLKASSTSSTPDGARTGHGHPPQLPVPEKPGPTEPQARINVLNDPAVTYDPTKAATLQAMPGPHPQGADLLGFLGHALRRADQPERAPIPDLEGNQYHAHWQRGVPLYHKTSVTVHAHPDLGVDGRLGAYHCVGPEWQLNVLPTHVLFGEETKDLLDALSLASNRLSLLAPTIIIGDLNTAPGDNDEHRPTHSHRHSDRGRHASTRPHRPHRRARQHTLPLLPPSLHPPLPHRHVLRGPNHSTRP